MTKEEIKNEHFKEIEEFYNDLIHFIYKNMRKKEYKVPINSVAILSIGKCMLSMISGIVMIEKEEELDAKIFVIESFINALNDLKKQLIN